MVEPTIVLAFANVDNRLVPGIPKGVEISTDFLRCDVVEL